MRKPDGEARVESKTSSRPVAGLLVAVLAIALIEALHSTVFHFGNIAPFLLLGVVAAAALFGRRAGLLCAALCLAYAGVVLSERGQPFQYDRRSLETLIVLAVAMPIAALAVGALRARLDLAGRERKKMEIETARLEERRAAHVERVALEEKAQHTSAELQRALADLQSTDVRLRLLAEALPALISYIDPQHRYVFCNRQYQEWFERPEELLVGKHLSEVLGQQAYEVVRPYLEQAFTGRRVEYEAWVLYSTGPRYIRATYVPDLREDGSVAGVAALVSDLSERRHLEEAQNFLSEAGEVLAQSLDYETTLRSVAKLAVPKVADWCAIDIVDTDGTRRRLAVEHVDPEKVKWALELQERYPPDENAPHGVPAVIRTGKSELYPQVPDELLVERAVDEEQLQMLRQIGFVSAMIVPMVTPERVVGAITYVSTDPHHHYGEDDLRLAESLAARAALAVENARLFRAARQEVVERRKTELALRESQEVFRSMADHAPVLIWMSDKDGRRTYFNKPWLDFTGATSEQAFGDGWLETVHPEDRSRCKDLYEESFQARRKLMIEYRLRRHDGMYRWVFDTGVPRFQADGTFLGFVGSSIDITDRKLNEEEIKRLNEDLEARVIARTEELRHANEELEAFSYSVSHDLRAPLRSISSYSRILQEEYGKILDDEGKDSLARILSASQRMAQLIDDLLKFARLAKTDLTPETLDLTAIANAFAAELRKRDPSRNATFEIREGMTEVADRQLMTIVIENLFENAWKFTSKNPHTVISFRSERQDGEKVYVLEDNGIGFDPAFAHKLFVPFERLHGQKDYPGTGIGLSNVKRIVERHGGTIWATGAVGKGARFSFTINLARAKNANDPARAQSRN